MDNISLETSVYWLSEDSFKIELEVYEKFAKNVTVISRKNHA